ncbi:MAG: ABC transporter permease subunit [Streptosporangiaceae bacterium]
MLNPTARCDTRPAALGLVTFLAGLGLLPLDPTLRFLLATSMAWAVAAVGLDIFSGYLGQPSFGHAGFVGLGAYGYAILGGRERLAPVVAAGLAIVAVAVVSMLIGLALVRLRDFGLVLGTFFLSYVVTSVLSGTTFAAITAAASGLQVPAARIGTVDLGHGTGYYYLCAAVLAVAVVISCNYAGSRSGRALRLVKRSDVIAAASGVVPWRAKLAAFTYSATLAASAGVLVAIGAGYIAPENFAAQQSIILFAMVAVGGLGSIAGPILGALLFTLVPNYLQAAGTSQDLLFAALLLAALTLFRDGLLGLLRLPLRRLRRTLLPARPDRPGRADSSPPAAAQSSQASPPAIASREVLTLSGLVLDYGGVRALDDVTLAVQDNSVHALVGPNGAGKTTLLNCISGLESPSRGQVKVGGGVLSHRGSGRARRLGVSRTFQNPSLVPDLSCRENVLLGSHLARSSWLLADLLGLDRRAERAAREDARQALGFVGIPSHRHDAPAAELSLAEAKLTDLARAIAMNGCLLVMDEPTAGLSGIEMAAVSSLIDRLRSRLAVLVVSHHVGWVKQVAQTVTVLAAGKVIASGDPHEVFQRPHVRDVFLGDPDTGLGAVPVAGPAPEADVQPDSGLDQIPRSGASR